MSTTPVSTTQTSAQINKAVTTNIRQTLTAVTSGLMEVSNNSTLESTTQISTSTVYFNKTQKSITELMYNGTGYYIEDEEETGLNDLHTLLLACFATLVFLAVTVSTAFGIRLLWKKYRTSKQNSQYDGILHREGTSESISRPLHSHLLDDKLFRHAAKSLSPPSLGLYYVID